MRSALLVAMAAMALLGLACGGEGGGAGQPIVYAGSIPIILVPNPDKLPFDASGSRLQQASQQMTKIAGHPIALQIDAALTSEWRSSFDDQLVAIIENAAHDLEAFKKDDPPAFARALPLLQKIECHYTATKKERVARFDASAHSLIVTEPGRSYGDLLERGLVYRALEEEYDAYTASVFGTLDIERVPPAQRAAAFAFLIKTRPGFGNLYVRSLRAKLPKNMTKAEELASDPYAELVLRILRLYELVGNSDRELAENVRAWLVEQMGHFSSERSTYAVEVKAAAPTTTFRRAETAWIRWASASLPSWTAGEKHGLARALFPGRGSCPHYARPCKKPDPLLPGFDAFGFGLQIENEWARAGHLANKDDDKTFELWDTVVCPYSTDDHGKRQRNRGCSAEWYLSALDEDTTRKRLSDALVQQNDPLFVETAFANLQYAQPENVVAFWRGLEPHPKEWKQAGVVIVDELLDERELTDDIVAEAKRVWHTAPDKRGTALYVIGSSQRHLDKAYGDHVWVDFSKRFGESVSREVFANMLDHGPRGVPLANTIWPALGHGWSRTEALAPHLDRFMDDPRTRSENPGDAVRTLRAIVERMCAEKNTSDVARMHTLLARRAQSHPNDAADLASLVEDTANGQCRARP